MKHLKNILIVLATQITIYIILFIGFSFLWKTLNIDNNISLTLVISLAILIYICICTKTSFKFYYWLLGIIPMTFLATIYHPHDLFGISNGGTLDFTPAIFDSFIFSVLLCLIQYIIYLILTKAKKYFLYF